MPCRSSIVRTSPPCAHGILFPPSRRVNVSLVVRLLSLGVRRRGVSRQFLKSSRIPGRSHHGVRRHVLRRHIVLRHARLSRTVTMVHGVLLRMLLLLMHGVLHSMLLLHTALVIGLLLLLRLLTLRGCCLALEKGRRWGVLAVQTFPDASKESLLATKLHLGALLVVSSTKLFERLAGFRRALAATHHVVVQHVEGLGGIRERLDAGRKESSRSVSSEAMAARQTRKARRQTLALAETIRLGKDARLHLAEQVMRKARRVRLVFRRHQRCRAGQLLFRSRNGIALLVLLGFRSRVRLRSILQVRDGVTARREELVRVATRRVLSR